MLKIRTTSRLARMRRRGVLALEWTLVVTVLVIGVIGGLGAVRNATLTELAQLSDVIEMFNVKTQAETMSEPGGS